MKHYFGIFLGIAFLIMSIPCFAFAGTSGSTPKETMSAASSSDGQAAENDTVSFKVYNHKTGKVETIAAGDYIKGVVAAEMPASYHTEALKAQAVAAHTYALKMKEQQAAAPTESLKGADISTDPSTSQSYMSISELKEFYGGQFDANYKKISDAVDAVLDKVILCDGELIAAAFHAVSGGTTEDAANVWGRSLSYLKPVLSDGDLLAPNYEAKTELASADVKAKLSEAFDGLTFPEDPAAWLTITSITESKSVKEAQVCGKTVAGTELREALGLPSTYFTVSYADGKFTFDTKGKGHGVGMSQYGADYLARQGKTYDEILKYYYTGVEIATVKANSEADQ